MLQEHFSVEEQARWRRGEEPLPWEEVYVWLDVLAMNQHTPKDMDFNTRWALLLALREMVQDAVQTLMVLDCVSSTHCHRHELMPRCHDRLPHKGGGGAHLSKPVAGCPKPGSLSLYHLRGVWICHTVAATPQRALCARCVYALTL
eukprot:353851-Chlamydomonas_euryale.AAC.8